MKSLAAAFQLHEDGATGAYAEIGCVIACQHLELGDDIRRRQDVQLASRAAVIDFSTVDHPVVVVGVGAVEA